MPVDITRYAEGAPDHSGALFNGGEGQPRLRLVARPHKSLTPGGFVWFIGATAALLALPLLTAFGSPVLWGLLPFVGGAIWAIWWGLKRSWRDMDLHEELLLWDDHVRLTHVAPRKADQVWDANPYWVQVRLTPQGGRVPDYVTLKGEGREVEIGAFLAAEERVELYHLLLREMRPG